MIVERTHYYAKPGNRDAVLAARRKACRVRVEIGLPAGSIYMKADSGADGPDVAWQCAFASAGDHQADLAARAESSAFEAVRAEMRALISHFDRLFESRAAHADGWSGDIPVETLSAVPQEHAFPSQGRELKGYLWTPPGAQPFPCVILNHGSRLSAPWEDAAIPGIPLLFASWGLACFFPHRHGYGNSPGPHWRSDCPGDEFSDDYNRQLVARLEREACDVLAAFAYLTTQRNVDAKRVAVMGASFGGINALLAASLEPRFRCAVNFAGGAMNWDRNPLLAMRLLAAAKSLKQPILLAQAANDFSVRPTIELAAILKAEGKAHEDKIYPAFGSSQMEGHLVGGRGSLVWGSDVRRFFERGLA